MLTASLSRAGPRACGVRGRRERNRLAWVLSLAKGPERVSHPPGPMPRCAGCFVSGLPQGGARRPSRGAAPRTGRGGGLGLGLSPWLGPGRCTLTAAGRPHARPRQPPLPTGAESEAQIAAARKRPRAGAAEKLRYGSGSTPVWGART